MDIVLSIVQLSQEKYDEYFAQIRASNLPRLVQGELIDLLQIALEQTQQAEDMAWL